MDGFFFESAKEHLSAVLLGRQLEHGAALLVEHHALPLQLLPLLVPLLLPCSSLLSLYQNTNNTSELQVTCRATGSLRTYEHHR